MKLFCAMVVLMLAATAVAADPEPGLFDQANLPPALQMTDAMKANVERLAKLASDPDAKPDAFGKAFIDVLRQSMAESIPAEGLDLPDGMVLEIPWEASGTITMPGLLPGVSRQEPVCGKGVFRLRPKVRIERPGPVE